MTYRAFVKEHARKGTGQVDAPGVYQLRCIKKQCVVMYWVFIKRGVRKKQWAFAYRMFVTLGEHNETAQVDVLDVYQVSHIKKQCVLICHGTWNRNECTGQEQSLRRTNVPGV